MKRISFVSLGVLILLCSISFVFAQESQSLRGSEGWGAGTPYAKLYNANTVKTIQGQIISIDYFQPLKGMSQGVHIQLQTSQGNYSVHLGPEWYISRQDFQLHKGDTVEVTGSEVRFSGKPTILAAEVRRGQEVLALRSENGVPLWSGVGRMKPGQSRGAGSNRDGMMGQSGKMGQGGMMSQGSTMGQSGGGMQNMENQMALHREQMESALTAIKRLAQIQEKTIQGLTPGEREASLSELRQMESKLDGLIAETQNMQTGMKVPGASTQGTR